MIPDPQEMATKRRAASNDIKEKAQEDGDWERVGHATSEPVDGRVCWDNGHARLFTGNSTQLVKEHLVDVQAHLAH